MLPANIGDLANLQDLNLSGNQLSGPIPESIGALTRLYSLGLDVNELTGLIPLSMMDLVNTNIRLQYNHLCTRDPDLIAFLDANAPGWQEGQTDTVCE